MPNWCETNITITLGAIAPVKEAQAQLNALVEKVRAKEAITTEDTEFGGTFLDALLPIPESLKIVCGSNTDYGMAIILSQKHNDHTALDEVNQYPWAKKLSREELIAHLIENKSADLAMGQQAIDNLKEYGCKTWYDWCCNNWGTKWDLGYMKMDVLPDEVLIFSQTAWSPPLIGITSISELYPLLHFTVEYAEPGCNFQGVAEIENGDCYDERGEYDYSQDEMEE